MPTLVRIGDCEGVIFHQGEGCAGCGFAGYGEYFSHWTPTREGIAVAEARLPKFLHATAADSGLDPYGVAAAIVAELSNDQRQYFGVRRAGESRNPRGRGHRLTATILPRRAHDT